MKRKIPDYLPLRWCKQIRREAGIAFKDDFNVDEALKDSALWWMYKVRTRSKALELCNKHRKSDDLHLYKDEYVFSCTDDIDTVAVVLKWEANKQVFKFDKDFLDMLIDTDDLYATEDAFKYLPFGVFYIDVSDNRYICNEINAEGFFVTVRLEDDNYWSIHTCRLDEKYQFSNVYSLYNSTSDVKITSDTGREVPIYDFTASVEKHKSTRKENIHLFQVLVMQVLTYLASAKPDILENAETKQTYRKPVGIPKNKYSEIRKWDVGIRIGSAVRTVKSKQSATNGATGLGGKKRPHIRKAHWHYYWFGPKDGHRVKRPIWLTEISVNIDGTDLPVVIHRN